jgi:hypothetical protein
VPPLPLVAGWPLLCASLCVLGLLHGAAPLPTVARSVLAASVPGCAALVPVTARLAPASSPPFPSPPLDSAVPVRPSTRGRTSRLSSFALVSSNGKLADAPASPTAIAHPPSSHIVVLPACARQYLLCRRISGSTGAVNEGEKQHRAAFQAQVRPAYGASEGRAASSVCCSCRSPFAHSCSAAPTPTAAPLLGWAIPAGQEAGRRRAMPPQGGRQAGRRGWGASGNSQN